MTIYNDKGSLERWLRVVQDIIDKPTQDLSLLDLCCGECTGTSRLAWEDHVGVDLEDWPARPAKVRFYLNDVRALYEFWRPDQFDVCICSDGIEHLTKEDGKTLLHEMHNVAKLAIIFTPLGSYLVEPDNSSPHAHKSGWLPEELEAMGWQVKTYPNWHSTLGVGAFFAYSGGL